MKRGVVSRGAKASLATAFASIISLSSAFAAESSTWLSPVTYIEIAAVITVVMTLLVIGIGKERMMKHRKLLFYLIVIPVVVATLYLAAHTVYKNTTSATGGPVHWHLDYQVWACGERLDLIDPKFPKNKIGSPLFHEHNDDRIHVEGTVDELDNVRLDRYFAVIGGELTATTLAYIDNVQGPLRYEEGDRCADGLPGELKVYVNGVHTDDSYEHLMYPHALVPPGDCVIVEFGTNLADTTERLCESWDVRGWDYENFNQKREDGDW